MTPEERVNLRIELLDLLRDRERMLRRDIFAHFAPRHPINLLRSTMLQLHRQDFIRPVDGPSGRVALWEWSGKRYHARTWVSKRSMQQSINRSMPARAVRSGSYRLPAEQRRLEIARQLEEFHSRGGEIKRAGNRWSETPPPPPPAHISR